MLAVRYPDPASMVGELAGGAHTGVATPKCAGESSDVAAERGCP